MQTRRLVLVIAISAAAMATSVSSQAKDMVDMQLDSLKQQHKFIMIDGERPSDDSLRTVLDRFYLDQFRSFQDPAAPYFLFMSRDSQLAMGIGGCVRLRGWYDWGGAIPSNCF